MKPSVSSPAARRDLPCCGASLSRPAQEHRRRSAAARFIGGKERTFQGCAACRQPCLRSTNSCTVSCNVPTRERQAPRLKGNRWRPGQEACASPPVAKTVKAGESWRGDHEAAMPTVSLNRCRRVEATSSAFPTGVRKLRSFGFTKGQLRAPAVFEPGASHYSEGLYSTAWAFSTQPNGYEGRSILATRLRRL
jgi:hypothetical protein